MIRRLRIALLNFGQGVLGKSGLDRHDRLCVGIGLRLRLADKREHFAHVCDVRGPERDALVVGVRIVIAVRQSEAALIELSDVGGTVLGVGTRAESEERIDAVDLQRGNHRCHALRIDDAADLGEQRVERGRSGLLDRRGVHAARVVVADLLFVGSRGGVALRSRLKNLVRHLTIFIDQNVRRTELRIRRRNRMILDPSAVCKLIEIVARLARSIERRGVDSAGKLLRRRSEASAMNGEERNGRNGREPNGKRNRKLHPRSYDRVAFAPTGAAQGGWY